MKVLAIGLVLTALVSTIMWAAFGPKAVFGAASFGLLATLIQVVAVAIARSAVDRSFDVFMLRWGVGMGLRLLGVVLFAVAAGLYPEPFPPLPTAIGYLGVLIPLLFTETRFRK